MSLNAVDVIHHLVTSAPSRLHDVPADYGIYALRDHMNEIRYIGITRSQNGGLKDRIYSKHVAGSSGRSHKFSHAYNTGRMWQDKHDTNPEAIFAKELRRAFARRFCSATFMVVPGSITKSEYWSALRNLEEMVCGLAHPDMLLWSNKRSFDPLTEPVEHVDLLLDELGWSRSRREAVARQAEAFIMRLK